jgi:hypothetical protein
MSKRLQVIVDDGEYRELQRIARRHKLTVSEWVRRAIRELSLREPAASPDRKLAVVREAATGGYPTADIGVMLAEIERGYQA